MKKVLAAALAALTIAGTIISPLQSVQGLSAVSAEEIIAEGTAAEDDSLQAAETEQNTETGQIFDEPVAEEADVTNADLSAQEGEDLAEGLIEDEDISEENWSETAAEAAPGEENAVPGETPETEAAQEEAGSDTETTESEGAESEKETEAESETETVLYEAEEILIEEETEGSTELEAPLPMETTYITASSYQAFSAAIHDLPTSGMRLFAAGSGQTAQYAAQRLIVKTDGAKVDFSVVSPGVVITGPDNTFMLWFESTAQTEAACEILNRTAHVRYAEPDQVLAVYSVIEDDEENAQNALSAYTGNSWGVKKTGAGEFAGFVKSLTNASITVAVVDSGVYTGHSFLSGRIASGAYNFGDGTTNVRDQVGHGTHIAGTIVDCTPGLNVRIMPLKVIDSQGLMYTSYAMNAVNYAVANGVKVINYSMGLDGYGHSFGMHDAVSNAVSNGVVFVMAAGNMGVHTSQDSCPAHMSEPIVVSAVDSSLRCSDFSNYGSSIDVAAPGEDIVSCSIYGGYVSMNGTSMAAPHISALAAMTRLVFTGYTPGQVESFLGSHSRDLGSSGKDQYYGYGFPDLSSSYTRFQMSTASVSLSQTAFQYTGRACRPSVTVTLGGNKLTQNVHYKLTYANDVNVGTASVTVTGLGYLSGSVKKTYTISRLATPVLVGVYNGAHGIGIKWRIEPSADSYVVYRKYKGIWSAIATVSANDSSLQRSGSTLMYTDPSVKSKYGEGYIYSVAARQGSTTTAFNKAGLAIYRLTPPSFTDGYNIYGKMALLSWSRVNCQGYQLQYAAKNNTGKWTVLSTQTLRTRLVTGLNKGMRYYFRIRCCKTNVDRGTTWSEYSPWYGVTINY